MKKGTKYGLYALGGLFAIGMLGQSATTTDMQSFPQLDSNYIETYSQEEQDNQLSANIENDKTQEIEPTTANVKTDEIADVEPQVQSKIATTDNTIAKTVYITENGKKYHKSTCRFVKKESASNISLDKAESEGYTPCKVCKP